MAQWIPYDRSGKLGSENGTYYSDGRYFAYELDRIGVAIITHNRPEFLKKILPTIPPSRYVRLFIINTGESYPEDVFKTDPPRPTFGYELYQFKEKTCVGHGKNKALELMLEAGCKHLFTMEDDVYIKDPSVFLRYIEAAHETGIWHFNFGFSQRENLDANLNPVYRKKIEYQNGISIVLTPNILGAFTYYYSGVLKHIGLHDPAFNHNHMDHVELTYRAIKAGLHPPFWWFADIDKSWEMIGNLSNMGSDSLVRNEEEVRKYLYDACMHFQRLHGCIPMQVPQTSEEGMLEALKSIREKYRQIKEKYEREQV